MEQWEDMISSPIKCANQQNAPIKYVIYILAQTFAITITHRGSDRNIFQAQFKAHVSTSPTEHPYGY